jgi:hypothetical protein
MDVNADFAIHLPMNDDDEHAKTRDKQMEERGWLTGCRNRKSSMTWR